MKSPLSTRLLCAVALGALALSPAHAQDPAPPGPPAAETPTETAPEAPSETPPDAVAPGAAEPAPAGEAPAAPVGEAAPAEPEVLEIVRETHGDWEVRCLPNGSECFLYQLALDEDENPVAEFSLVALPAGEEAVAGVTVVTPLGTLLPAGIGLGVDGAEIGDYGFTFCSQVGCFARFGLSGEVVDRLKRGLTARLELVSIAAPEQPVTLDLSLTGFTAAYNSLAAAPAPPAE